MIGDLFGNLLEVVGGAAVGPVLWDTLGDMGIGPVAVVDCAEKLMGWCEKKGLLCGFVVGNG